jgi:hypothetical protein
MLCHYTGWGKRLKQVKTKKPRIENLVPKKSEE